MWTDAIKGCKLVKKMWVIGHVITRHLYPQSKNHDSYFAQHNICLNESHCEPCLQDKQKTTSGWIYAMLFLFIHSIIFLASAWTKTESSYPRALELPASSRGLFDIWSTWITTLVVALGFLLLLPISFGPSYRSRHLEI